METERIIGAAVRDPVGRVWSRPGAIHADLPAGTAGWMTSSGRFVTRAEAERIIDAIWRSCAGPPAERAIRYLGIWGLIGCSVGGIPMHRDRVYDARPDAVPKTRRPDDFPTDAIGGHRTSDETLSPESQNFDSAILASLSHQQEGYMSLENLSRRALMAGARAFTVAASLPPALAAASALPHSGPPLSEDANLLALGEEIDPLLNAYRAAAERKRQARAVAEALCPSLPDELVVKRNEHVRWIGCTEREVDVEGKDVWPPNHIGPDGKTYASHPREIIKGNLIKEAIASGEIYASRRSKHGKEIWRLIGISEKYETERAAAIERSGLLEAAHELFLSAEEIEALAYEVRKHEPVTMIGVMIQARALAAHAEAELDAHGFVGRSGTVLGRELAASVLRIAGGSRGDGAAL